MTPKQEKYYRKVNIMNHEKKLIHEEIENLDKLIKNKASSSLMILIFRDRVSALKQRYDRITTEALMTQHEKIYGYR